MAGHSKFKNIMHRKGAQDAKRARLFTKIAREITVATKSGMPDPDMNPRLRAAIAAAKQANMPNERIERAIKSGSGEGDAENYDEMRYEGYGPGGVAVIIEALTDNRNRTAAEIRSAFTKHGGTMGETNSVSFMFERVGQIVYPASAGDADTMFEVAAEAGAENVESNEESHEITTPVEDFAAVRDALAEKLGDPERATLAWVPQNTIPVNEDQAATLLKLLDVLDDNDDVQTVSANFDIADEVMERLAS